MFVLFLLCFFFVEYFGETEEWEEIFTVKYSNYGFNGNVQKGKKLGGEKNL